MDNGACQDVRIMDGIQRIATFLELVTGLFLLTIKILYLWTFYSTLNKCFTGKKFKTELSHVCFVKPDFLLVVGPRSQFKAGKITPFL